MRACFRLLIILLAGCLLVACGSSRQWQASEEALAGNPLAMLEDGLDAVRQGEALVDRGEDRIADSRRMVSEGNELIREGNDLIIVSRRDYRAASRTAGTASTPEQVDREGERLRNISRRWEDGITGIERGNRLVETGNERIGRGQSEVREGQALMESGRNLIRNAEQIGNEINE